MAITVLVLAVLPFFMPVMQSCGGGKKEMVEVEFDPETSYTLKETHIESYVSDSGITRYKIEAETWLMYGKAKEPFWFFPDGVYLEKFDTLFNIEASIKSDSAYYYERRKIWELDGNVDISNLEGVRFQTQQLFWDQNREKIYSDSFIKITKGENINYGVGFVSNQDMSVYEIFNPMAEFFIVQGTAAPDSAAVVASDTTVISDN